MRAVCLLAAILIAWGRFVISPVFAQGADLVSEALCKRNSMQYGNAKELVKQGAISKEEFTAGLRGAFFDCRKWMAVDDFYAADMINTMKNTETIPIGLNVFSWPDRGGFVAIWDMTKAEFYTYIQIPNTMKGVDENWGRVVGKLAGREGAQRTNCVGSTLLSHAVRLSSTDGVRSLVALGADPNGKFIKTYSGGFPTWNDGSLQFKIRRNAIAGETRYAFMTKDGDNHCVDIEKVGGTYLTTPIAYAIQNVRGYGADALGVVDALISVKAAVPADILFSAFEADSGRFLLIPRIQKDAKLIELLLRNGADVNARGPDGKTLLGRLTSQMTDPDTTGYFIGKGAKL